MRLQHLTLFAISLMCVHCTGSLDNASSSSASPDSGQSSPDIPGSSQDMAPSQDMGAGEDLGGVGEEMDPLLPSVALRVEHDARLLPPSSTLDLGGFEVGQTQGTCQALTLTNDGDLPITLIAEVDQGSIYLEESATPSLEPGATSLLKVCVTTEEPGAKQATLTLTDAFSLQLTARVHPATPLLATGPQSLQLSQDRGKTWTQLPLPEGLTTVRGALWAMDRLWLFGEGSKPLWHSEDGVTWREAEGVSAEITGISGLAEDAQGNFMGVHEQEIIHSSQGKEWSVVADTVSEDETFLDITYFKGQFVAVGDSITAISDDGKSWKERRGWETSVNSRVIANGDHIFRVVGSNLQISDDAKTWKTDYTFCRDTMTPPSAPVFSSGGAILSRCNGILGATSRKWSWRKVGTPTGMPTPLTFALESFYGVDDSNHFVWSRDALTWTEAERGDATGVERIVAASPPTTAPSAPTPGACDAGALACIDFEQELPGLPPIFQYGLRAGRENVVAIDEAFAFSGERSMRVDAFAEEGGQAGMITLEKEDFPDALRDKIYGRMMFYTSAYPVRNWHMSESGGALDAQNMTRVQYNAGGDHARAFHNYYGNGADCWNRADFTYPQEQWFCWQVEYDRVHNTMVISVDGQEVHRMSGMGQGCLGGQGAQTIWQAPLAFEHFRIGYHPFKTQEQDLTTWIDDVAISNTPIPCPNEQ